MDRPRIVCLGEALIDFLQLPDGDSFKRQAGGAPLNVACGAAKLGARASMITMLGRDLFGDFLEHTMVEHGVELAGVRRTDQALTALAFVALDDKGERTFSFYRKPCADQLLGPSDVEAALLDARLDAFHFGSISLISEPSASATRSAAARARAVGAWVSYDPNLRERLWPDLETARRTMLDAMPLADIVKVSDSELRFLTGHDGQPGAAALLRLGPAFIVVTHGARGCVVYRDGHAPLEAAAPSVTVVDTTGAGDAFVAAFLDALVRSGANDAGALTAAVLEQAATWGNAAGALATTKHGAIPSLPSRAEVSALLGGP